MKPSLIIASITLLFLSSCNNPSTETKNDTPVAESPIQTTCYAYKVEGISVLLKVERKGNTVTGNVIYDFKEKDDNAGNITGEFKGDTLFADYKFISEGVESTRELAFIKSGDQLIEGYGEVEEKDGKTVFKNHNSIDYTNGIILKLIDCEK